MKKSILISLVCLVAVGSGLVFYFSKNKNKSVNLNPIVETTKTENQKVISSTENNKNNKNNLKNLLTKGNYLKCEMNEEGFKGTYYIDGKKERVRVVMKSLDGEKTVENNILVLGKETYSWANDGVNKIGYKFIDDGEEDSDGFDEIEEKWEEFDQMADSEKIESENDSGLDFESEFNGDCQAWRLDESIFTVPADIKFNDMSNLSDQFEKAVEGQEDPSEENIGEYMKQLESMGIEIDDKDLEMLGDLNE
jgi:hypothetical protein